MGNKSAIRMMARSPRRHLLLSGGVLCFFTYIFLFSPNVPSPSYSLRPSTSLKPLDPLPPVDPWTAWPPNLSYAICRPKIYVYDLPEELKLSDEARNHPCFGSNYKSEILLWEKLTEKGGKFNELYVTNNPEEADFFYIPFMGACWLTANCWQLNGWDFSGRCDVDNKYVTPLFRHIIEHYPYWNRSGGADHIMVHPMDHTFNYYDAKEIFQPAIFLTTVGDKRGDQLNSNRFTNNIVIPSATGLLHRALVDPRRYLDKYGNPLAKKHRDIFALFRGCCSTTKPTDPYSMGVRSLLFNGLNQIPGWDVSESSEDEEYIDLLSRSRYGITPAGWTLDTTRLWEYLAFGVVPVIIADGIIEPFENDVDWHSFSVYVRREDAHLLDDILRAIPEEEYQRKRKRVWEEGARVGLERDAWHFIARELCRIKRIDRREIIQP
ncbi:uncharacterized protein VTP21DRAFT_2006 [Calcarisporiella thermophila]|uniref:uncharacterized protein n=1 Tax=Calcarisporiella thermophila TaxID=911321 RepID=UPI0037422E78